MLTYEKAQIADNITSVDIVSDTDPDASFFRALESKGTLLNERQVEAVRHGEGPALVLAAAGSGKTSVLTSRCNYLISQFNVKSILLLTFTNKAATEMVERIGRLSDMSKEEADNITAGTFHSVFLSILRQNGVTKEIWSSGKAKEITIKTILRKLGMEKFFEPEVILGQISSYKNKLINIKNAPQETKYQKDFVLIWKEYERHKEQNQLIDFDDMLLLTYELFKEKPEVLEAARNKFHYILVDEFQDTNLAQYELVKMIAWPRNNIFAVGDDFQCIYGFNGARSENMLEFKTVFPDAKIIPLEINYRSTDYIVGLGTDIINKNTEQMKKNVLSVKPSNNKPNFREFMTAEEEANSIINEIEELVQSKKEKYKDTAILYRNNSNSRAVFDELLIRKIPFVQFGGNQLFYEDAIVKPVIAYLRLSLRPSDSKSIEQILPTLYLKKDLIKYISSQQLKNPLNSPIEHLLNYNLKPFQLNKVREKIGMIKRLSNYKPVIAINMIREDYEKYLLGEENESATTLHKEIIKETLNELVSSSARFETIEEYIGFINQVIKNSIIQKEMQKNPNSDSIKLMTIHRSKGLEFSRVYIIHCSEGVIPSAVALEECKDVFTNDVNYNALSEERRLMYVGVTRAKENLTVSSLKLHRGKPVEPSRFIQKYIG